MRIALVTESFHPAADETTSTVRHVADRLVDTGHEVLMVAAAPGVGTYRGCRVARIRPLEPAPGRRRLGRQVHEALATFAPDLVHVLSPGRLGRRTLRHAVRLGVPSLVTQGSPVPDADADRWVRTVGSRADRVVVTCRAMSARLAELGIDAAVWAPGVDVDEFTPVLRDQRLHDKWARARSRGGPLLVVGYVGDLRKREGTRRLADVARVPGVRLVVVGEGPQREWLDENIQGAKVLTGPGAHDRAVALASFDVLVHPGLEQTSCHVLREAAASGVPVVAPAAGGTPDAVRHGRTGLLHDPEDPRALRRAVATLAGDGVLRASLGAQGRARSLHRTWADAVDELLAVHHPATPGGATLPAA